MRKIKIKWKWKPRSGPAESLTAEQLQSSTTPRLPCINVTAQAQINYRTSTVTVTTVAVRLSL